MKKNLIGFLRKSALGPLLDLDSLALLSERAEACPLQDPFRIRARFLGWKCASLLLDDKGGLKKDLLGQLIQAFEKGSHPVGQPEGDASLYKHLYACLQQLQENDAIWRALKKCSLPLCNKDAEEIVRDTLWPDEIGTLTHADVRRAVLTAWLTLLRQATGSCFATAPAMLIQSDDSLRLIRDLDVILSTGELRRGSYAAPLHSGSSPGDLQKPIGTRPAALCPGLIAAFHAAGVPFPRTISSEYSSKRLIEESLLVHFGLSQEDLDKESVSLAPQFGVLWERVGGHFGGASSKARQIHSWEIAVKKAKRAFLAVADCALLRSWEYTLASFSDVKVEFARWNLYVSLGLNHGQKPPGIGAFLLRSIQEKLDAVNTRIVQMGREHQRAAQSVRATERLLNQALSEGEQSRLKAEIFADVHAVNSLATQIDEERKMAQWLTQLFSQFLKEAIEGLQASFQEVFDPALGDAEAERFEDSLAGFRLLYKSGRSAAASWERIENERQFVNAVFKFFQSLESQYRVDVPMQSCFTLVMTELLQYIRSEEFISASLERAKENKSAKNALPWAYESGGTMQTLVQSYYDLRARPQEFSRQIRTPLELYRFLCDAALKTTKNQHLMVSPTHAFLFHPSLMGSQDALEKGARFIKGLSVSYDQIQFLIERLAEWLPPEARPLFYFGCRQQVFPDTIAGLGSLLASGWQAAKQPRPEKVDAFLYGALPVLTPEETKQALERMSLRLGISPPVKSMAALPCDLIQIIRAGLLVEKGAFSTMDWDMQLAKAAREEGIAYPEPILFADTNWSDWTFGIVRNIATGEPELWRLSRTGLSGVPMSDWNHLFLEGGRWSVLL